MSPAGPKAFFQCTVNFQFQLRESNVFAVGRNACRSLGKPRGSTEANKKPSAGQRQETGIEHLRKFSSLCALRITHRVCHLFSPDTEPGGDTTCGKGAPADVVRRQVPGGPACLAERTPGPRALFKNLRILLFLFPPWWPFPPTLRKKNDSEEKNHAHGHPPTRRDGSLKRRQLVNKYSKLILKLNSPFISALSFQGLLFLWYFREPKGNSHVPVSFNFTYRRTPFGITYKTSKSPEKIRKP